MRKYLSDRNLVIVLFVLVLITFSFAHEDSKKLQQFSIQQIFSSESNTPGIPQKIVQVSSPTPTKYSSEVITR
ncbi:MAG: hypothetical protein JST17_02220 [Bacteroidetes bacterium]|nr:hypothetical protein [Bacteroidota bacterium]MBS1931357.1 hypothetical protein [Bacteroidota bacterium]